MWRAVLLIECAIACTVACGGSSAPDAGSDAGTDVQSGPSCKFDWVYINADCGFNFGPCSDGHTYRVNCPGTGGCDCQVDYADAGSTATNLCTLPSDSQSLKDAINAGCGWSLTSSP